MMLIMWTERDQVCVVTSILTNTYWRIRFLSVFWAVLLGASLLWSKVLGNRENSGEITLHCRPEGLSCLGL